VRDDRHGRVAEDAIEDLRVVDQHVAGRGAHEDLHARCGTRVQPANGFEIVVARAEIEAVVRPCAPVRAPVFVFQRRRIQCRRRRVGHVHEAGEAARDRRCRLGADVGLVFESRFAEMHLVINHARQQPASFGIDDGFAVARMQAGADLVDPAVFEAQVAVEFASFVDQAGVDDQCRWHSVVLSDEFSGGTGSKPPGCSGWQRARRRSANQLPLSAPKREIASIA
jgi:hypothetical protein